MFGVAVSEADETMNSMEYTAKIPSRSEIHRNYREPFRWLNPAVSPRPHSLRPMAGFSLRRAALPHLNYPSPAARVIAAILSAKRTWLSSSGA